MAFELVEKDSLEQSKRRELKIYFNDTNKKFGWKYYPEIEGHLTDAYYSDMYYETRQKLDNLFKPNTWYLFDFFNPHFDVFVFCDSARQIKFVKRDLNPNF